MARHCARSMMDGRVGGGRGKRGCVRQSVAWPRAAFQDTGLYGVWCGDFDALVPRAVGEARFLFSLKHHACDDPVPCEQLSSITRLSPWVCLQHPPCRHFWCSLEIETAPLKTGPADSRPLDNYCYSNHPLADLPCACRIFPKGWLAMFSQHCTWHQVSQQ